MLKKGLLVLGIATIAVAVFHQRFAPVAVFYAAKRQNVKIIKYYLARGVDVNTVYGYQCTSWCWDYLNLEGEYDLIYRGAGSGEWSYSGTLLDVAVAKNNLQMVKLLLTHGADINAQIALGLTPLGRAVNRDNLQMVKFLIAHGADAKKDVTALHEAIYKGNKKMIELLITHGADINAKDGTGETLLHVAARSGKKETVKLLLAKGANVLAKDIYGKTPLGTTSNQDIQALLKHHSATYSNPK